MVEPLPDGSTEPPIKKDDTTVMSAASDFRTVPLHRPDVPLYLETIDISEADLLVVDSENPQSELRKLLVSLATQSQRFYLTESTKGATEALAKRGNHRLAAGILINPSLTTDDPRELSKMTFADQVKPTIDFIKDVRSFNLSDADGNHIDTATDTDIRIFCNAQTKDEFIRALEGSGINPKKDENLHIYDSDSFQTLHHDLQETMPMTKPVEPPVDTEADTKH